MWRERRDMSDQSLENIGLLQTPLISSERCSQRLRWSSNSEDVSSSMKAVDQSIEFIDTSTQTPLLIRRDTSRQSKTLVDSSFHTEEMAIERGFRYECATVDAAPLGSDSLLVRS
jgi:hypothetical protein